jgi:hypothetical protein
MQRGIFTAKSLSREAHGHDTAHRSPRRRGPRPLLLASERRRIALPAAMFDAKFGVHVLKSGAMQAPDQP